MALTKSEIEDLKVLFGFGLEINEKKRAITTRHFLSKKQKKFLVIKNDKLSTHNKYALMIKILNIINDTDKTSLRIKGIRVALVNCKIYFQGILFFEIMDYNLFVLELNLDLIKSQRMHRIYSEYILEKMKLLVNDKT